MIDLLVTCVLALNGPEFVPPKGWDVVKVTPAHSASCCNHAPGLLIYCEETGSCESHGEVTLRRAIAVGETVSLPDRCNSEATAR